MFQTTSPSTPTATLYIADCGNNRIRKVDKQGVITTVAGNGTAGFSGDGGPATGAELNLERSHASLAIDVAGNVYVTDGGNDRVRKIDNQGIITTIAGSGGSNVSADGGLATDTALTSPAGLAFDAEGNLFVASAGLHEILDSRVRKIDKHAIITSVAGTDELDFSGDDGPATSATINQPQGIAFDRDGIFTSPIPATTACAGWTRMDSSRLWPVGPLAASAET